MSFSFLKEPKNEMELLMGDIVRVLNLLLGTLWLSELSIELSSFRSSLERPLPFNDIELENALKNLKDQNVVTSQKGLKATFENPKPDILVRLVTSHPFPTILESDKDIKKYRALSK